MKRIKVVSYSDSIGGASIACRRQLSELEDFEIDWIVSNKKDLNSSAISEWSWLKNKIYFLKRVLSFILVKLQVKNRSQYKCSINLFSNSFVYKQVKSGELFHLHWINNDTLSLLAIYLIVKNPKNRVIITMHDDWLISGVEHCLEHDDERYQTGFTLKNSSIISSLVFYIKRMIFIRSKCKLLITTPSKYLQDKVLNSKILSDKSIVIVPNSFTAPNVVSKLKTLGVHSGIDTTKYDSVFFISSIIDGNYLKGYDLFVSFLKIFHEMNPNRKVAIIRVGGKNNGFHSELNFDIYDFGYVSNESTLSELYKMSDITLVFSRSESFGQVALESLYFGTPVFAFDCTGISDFVEHGKNGFLIEPFDNLSYATLVSDYLYGADKLKRNMLIESSVISKFDNKKVASKWKEIYNSFYYDCR